MSEPTDGGRRWPKLRYETRDGEVVIVEADFIHVVGGNLAEHILVSNAIAIVDSCNLRAHSCKIEAEGCVVEPLTQGSASPPDHRGCRMTLELDTREGGRMTIPERRGVVVRIDPLEHGGWGYAVEWENGGRSMGGCEDFPSAVTAVIYALREGQRHVSAA